LYRRCLADRTAVSGYDSQAVISLRHNLNLVALHRARKAREGGDPERAVEMLRAALPEREAICSDARRVLAPEHWLTLSCEAERLGMLTESGQAAEAAASYPGLVAAQRRALGRADWRTIQTQARHGKALALAGRGQDAEEVLRDALEAYRLGWPADKDTYKITDFLVDHLVSMCRIDDAWQVLERSCRDAASLLEAQSVDDESPARAAAARADAALLAAERQEAVFRFCAAHGARLGGLQGRDAGCSCTDRD
jgi:tetratricopeptide (TPR) repeat protein